MIAVAPRFDAASCGSVGYRLGTQAAPAAVCAIGLVETVSCPERQLRFRVMLSEAKHLGASEALGHGAELLRWRSE
jgi:hypothetical protein